MVDLSAPMSTHEAERILRESQRISKELDDLRPRNHWLRRQLGRILEENHLSEKIRHALEGQ